MAHINDHPTVKAVRAQQANLTESTENSSQLDGTILRQLCLDCGADDAGFVSLSRQEIADQRDDILAVFPSTRTLISLVFRENREPIRSPAGSVSNLEFHHVTDHANIVARQIVAQLEQQGIRAMNPAAGFPMEMDRYPGKIWVVSHKPVAEAAGMGKMGIHRNVIHPKFGSFIILDTILIGADVSDESQPIDYNPCVECKLCVAACPVGAIAPDGHFDAFACATHNYREFMGGFTDWVTQIADSKDASDYRRRVTDSETASHWQSLGFGPNYKSAYCLAVCPAGEDVIGPFLQNKAGFLQEIVKPLQDKIEPVYVIAGSDAEAHVQKRFPHKRPRRISNGVRTRSIAAFLWALPIAFQRGQSKGLDATYHFTFTGDEERKATVIISDQKIQVRDGHHGKANLHITADSQTWLHFLWKEQILLSALLLRKVRLQGSPRLLQAFGRCFPS